MSSQQTTSARLHFKPAKALLSLFLLGLSIFGALIAFWSGGWYLHLVEQRALQSALPALSRALDQTLGELESRLNTDNYLEVNTPSQLATVFQVLREDVPFVSALEIRDAEGALLMTSAALSRTENRLLSPGYAALFESSVKSGRPGYSSVYAEPMRGQDGHFFDLFIVSRWGQKQGLIAKLSATDLLRISLESLDRDVMSGLDLVIKEAILLTPQDASKPLWPAEQWLFERNGLRLTLSGKASSPLANTSLALQWLLACLGGLAALSVSL
jgi:hypothetical protein